jgi:hypothetical protein
MADGGRLCTFSEAFLHLRYEHVMLCDLTRLEVIVSQRSMEKQGNGIYMDKEGSGVDNIKPVDIVIKEL